MEIHIGTITQEESGPSISLIDEISEEQHKELLNSLKEIQNLESNRRLFEIAFLNKNDFVDTLNRDASEMMQSSLTIAGNSELYYKHHLNFNRLFLNYLSSIKTFIDHNETFIKHKFGSTSYEAMEFEKITNYYFDTFFCYRFFIQLRNYAQHCGMPLSQFNITTTRNDDGSYMSTLEIDFNPQELLANYSKWSRIVKEDLKTKTSNFKLAPLVEEMTQVLIGFWKAVDILQGASVLNAARYIKKLTDHLRADNTDICIFSNIIDNHDGSLKNIESKTIPFDIIDLLDVSGSS